MSRHVYGMHVVNDNIRELKLIKHPYFIQKQNVSDFVKKMCQMHKTLFLFSSLWFIYKVADSLEGVRSGANLLKTTGGIGV